MHNFNQLLRRIYPFKNFFAFRSILDIRDKSFHNSQVYIGIQKRASNLSQRILHVVLSKFFSICIIDYFP